MKAVNKDTPLYKEPQKRLFYLIYSVYVRLVKLPFVTSFKVSGLITLLERKLNVPLIFLLTVSTVVSTTVPLTA